MKKDHKIIGVCIIAAGCLIAVGITAYCLYEKIQQDNYIRTSGMSFSQGETALLDSSKDEEGRKYGYTAGLDWHGGIEATVEDSTVYQSVEEFGVTEVELFESQQEPSVFLVCRLKLRNVDAVVDASYTSPRSEMKNFNMNVFSLQIAGESRKIVYFDGTIEGTEEKYRTLYELDQGEEKEFLVGYFISPKDLEQDIYYKVGVSATCVKYRLFLNPVVNAK